MLEDNTCTVVLANK